MKGNPFMKKTIDKNKNEVDLVMNEELMDHLSILQ
tara:strand:- start:3315 stop:3419 length:105 start_codon:yes stop_codon:yes gene_type:complete